jgi:hypothetical protein
MFKFVDLEALNLRSEPRVAASTRLGTLHLGQRVEVLGPAAEPGWLDVRAVLNGEIREGVVKEEIAPQPATGFVPRTSLREAVSPEREAVIAEAIGQWLRFDKGLGKEHQTPYFQHVGQMWQAIGLNLDGQDSDVPWSAAAISFMVRRAGQAQPASRYGRFKFAAAHARYLHASIKARRTNDLQAPYWGFRLHEQRPQLGDIVARWRETPRDYDDAAVRDDFKSHTDIVVSIGPDELWAIGGNIANSVSISRYAKTAAGFVAESDATFMLMVNQH